MGSVFSIQQEVKKLEKEIQGVIKSTRLQAQINNICSPSPGIFDALQLKLDIENGFVSASDIDGTDKERLKKVFEDLIEAHGEENFSLKKKLEDLNHKIG